MIHTATHPGKPITAADGGEVTGDHDADLLLAALAAEAEEDDQ